MKDAASPLQTVLYGANLCPVAELLTLEFDSAQTWVSDAGVSTTTTAEADGKHRIRWAEAKADVSFGGETWKTGGPGLQIGSRARTSSGTQIDDLDLTLHGGSVTLGGKAIPVAAVEHILDGVSATWLRAYFAADGSVAGVVEMFGGVISDPEPSSTRVRVTLKSALSQIQASVPWRTVQASCPFAVYDEDCGVAVRLTHARTVAAGSDATKIVLSAASDYAMTGSWLEFASGATATILDVSGATLTLAMPLDVAPVIGSAVTVVRGCDHVLSTCQTIFNNVTRYGGQVYVPTEGA